MKILVLNETDMRRVFSMKMAVQADKDALELYSSGLANIPLRANLDIPEFEGQSLYMYGYAAPAKALGVKIVSVYPNNIEKGLTSVPATMVLVNAETGEVCCMMDGTFLTRIRTGAVAGAATDVLARQDAECFALFGTGGQAETQLEAVLSVRPVKTVKVYDLNHERAVDFSTRMQSQLGPVYGVEIRAASSAAEALQDADIVTAVTTARTAVFDGKLVKPDAHVNGVGSYTPDMAEIDRYIVEKADVVAVDTRDGALNESGDLINPIKAGTLDASSCVELGEIISGKAKGRTTDDQLTFFETTGSAVLDLVTAQRIYESATKQEIGQVIEF